MSFAACFKPITTKKQDATLKRKTPKQQSTKKNNNPKNPQLAYQSSPLLLLLPGEDDGVTGCYGIDLFGMKD